MLLAEWNKSPFSQREQQKVLATINSFLRLRKKFLLSVAFVTPAVIKKLNRDYRGKNKVTDVLSFSFIDSEIVGEIIICLDQAKKQARKFDHSVNEEIKILLVHGALHIFGFDHVKSGEAKKMFAQQKNILKKLKINWQGSEPG